MGGTVLHYFGHSGEEENVGEEQQSAYSDLFGGAGRQEEQNCSHDGQHWKDISGATVSHVENTLLIKNILC